MKKIYSVMLIMVSLWAPSLNAQTCPTASARAFIGAASCWVTIQNAIPNAEVVILDQAGNIISTTPAPSTNASGYLLIFYNCSSSPSVANIVVNSTLFCTIIIPAPAILPIKIKTFTAHSQGDNSVMLRWTSVFEANSSKYIVQKSTDGHNFSDIGDIKAAGQSLASLNYTFSDRQMANGTAYYRLKLIDLDGTVDYTKIIYINNGSATFYSLSVFPNPFTSEVQLKGVTSNDVNRKNIKIYSAMGTEVNYRVIGGNSIIIDPSVPKGVYILRVKGESFKLFKK